MESIIARKWKLDPLSTRKQFNREMRKQEESAPLPPFGMFFFNNNVANLTP